MRSPFAYFAALLTTVLIAAPATQVAVPTIAYAVSFDCNKAKTLVEHTICTNTELLSLDDQLAVLYKETMGTTDNKESLRTDQRRWLTIRNNCKDIECLKKVYVNRINDLRGAYTIQVAGDQPRLAPTYTGTIHNTTYNRKATLTLTSIVENQGNISGQVIIGHGLGGSGRFTGTIDANGSVNFEVNSIFFEGSLHTDGSFSGTYNAPRTRQGGIWQTTAATQAEGERPAGSGEIPVHGGLLGRYVGTAENTTVRAHGRMSIDIERSDQKGYVQLKMKAWDGLMGEGTFIGEISSDGQLRATGTFSDFPSDARPVFVQRRVWKCNIIGVISDNKFKGNYSLFPETVAQPCVQLPGYPCPSTRKEEGSFDVEKFKPLVRPQ